MLKPELNVSAFTAAGPRNKSRAWDTKGSCLYQSGAKAEVSRTSFNLLTGFRLV